MCSEATDTEAGSKGRRYTVYADPVTTVVTGAA